MAGRILDDMTPHADHLAGGHATPFSLRPGRLAAAAILLAAFGVWSSPLTVVAAQNFVADIRDQPTLFGGEMLAPSSAYQPTFKDFPAAADPTKRSTHK